MTNDFLCRLYTHVGNWNACPLKKKKKKKKKNLFFAQKPNIKMNKHVNKVRKATGRAEAITAGRQQIKQQSWP